MANGTVRLIPGINLERTPTLNEAGYSQSSLIRFRDGLVEKIGGWVRYFSLAVSGVPRDLHAWQDLNNVIRLAVGATTSLGVITSGSYVNLTPQTKTTDFAPKFTTVLGSFDVEVDDSNISNVTTYDSVFFNTPISVGGIILSGFYPIAIITGATKYKITAATAATANVTNGGAVPTFTTVVASDIVTVALTAHGMSVGSKAVFSIATTGNGVTISGSYTVQTVPDANHFTITVSTQATAASTFSMNGGNAELVYYIALGPPPLGAGYGTGAYGAGGYGTGVINPSQQGSPITATDWTSDNWGEILLACPFGGAIYWWQPNTGFITMRPVENAPPFNGGMFVSIQAQIVIAWGSTIDERINFPVGIGMLRDPMLVQWSDSGNFFQWTVTSQTQAGNFRIPLGSEIRGGMAVSNQNLIWTDLDCWAMNYVGPPDVYGFNKIGAGAGLAGSHAAQQFRGAVYWMGSSNFYRYAGGSVEVIPCSVWDVVFQNLNTAHIKNVRAMPNTGFNEVGWFYPSTASSSGECDSYVKMNVTEQGQPWDYGPMARSAWIDQSVAGPPIGASPGGIIYQHEMGYNADGQPITWSFTTGFFVIAEAEDFPFVDEIIPDFKYATYGGSANATINFTFNVVNYPWETPDVFGPYPTTQSTTYIATRFRGRQMSITMQGSDLDSFARLGRVRYRWSAQGRR